MTMEKKIKIGLILLTSIIVFSIFYVSTQTKFQKIPPISDIECISYMGIIIDEESYLKSEITIYKNDPIFEELYILLVGSIEDESIETRFQLMGLGWIRVNTTSGKKLVYSFSGWRTKDGKITVGEVIGPMGLKHSNDDFVKFIEIISERKKNNK